MAANKSYTSTNKHVSMPIVAMAVPAGGQATISVRPQEVFHTQLLRTSKQSDDFIINSITVGTKPQAVASGPIASDVFSGVNNIPQSWDIANEGTDVIFSVTNRHATAAKDFLGVLFGDQLE